MFNYVRIQKRNLYPFYVVCTRYTTMNVSLNKGLYLGIKQQFRLDQFVIGKPLALSLIIALDDACIY